MQRRWTYGKGGRDKDQGHGKGKATGKEKAATVGNGGGRRASTEGLHGQATRDVGATSGPDDGWILAMSKPPQHPPT